MTQDASQDPASSQARQSTKLDLSAYRTSDLVEHLADLISVPGALRKVVKAVLLVVVLTAIAVGLISSYSQMSLLPWLGMCSYALVLGVLFGFVLGILRILSAMLTNIESILSIVLEISAKVLSDHSQWQTGAMAMPTGGELIEKVSSDVVLPALNRAIEKAFGFLATPIRWVSQRTIGFAVHRLVKQVSRWQAASAVEESVVLNVNSTLSSISKYVQRSQETITLAKGYVSKVGRRIRRYAITPLYVLFFFFLAVAAMPIALICYLASD